MLPVTKEMITGPSYILTKKQVGKALLVLSNDEAAFTDLM